MRQVSKAYLRVYIFPILEREKISVDDFATWITSKFPMGRCSPPDLMKAMNEWVVVRKTFMVPQIQTR